MNELPALRSIKEEAGSWSDTDIVEKISDSQEIGWDNLLNSSQLWYSKRSYENKSSVIFKSPDTYLKYITMFYHMLLSQCPWPHLH